MSLDSLQDFAKCVDTTPTQRWEKGCFEMSIKADKLSTLLEYVKSDGRVCPMPTYWNKLWEMLLKANKKLSGGSVPPPPLILAAWWDVPALPKMLRLVEHIKYAATNGVLDEADAYLRDLRPDQWAYGDGTTEWKSHKNEDVY